uniref:Uncharacterized protein LOC100378799 n=1 Tax=Saccoglossus kowalevskii TaxID=10224 RepID=A0ABM0LWK9_SACKO|nr:PREDICTED: uncharacterized protein LOC100378799 [Saccoglossus kowalevskii]
MKCVVFFDPEGYREKMLPNSDAKNIDEYFVRAKIMQDMVESVNNTIKKFCPTDTYLAMHWRNKTKEWCTENSEHSATCDSLKDKVAEVTRMIAETVADVMKQSKIQCVYVAHPIGSEEIIRYLNENIQARRRIFTQDDLNIRFPDPMEDAQMKELLEEELCHGAETFIGWPKSMWSQAIIHRRDIEGKKNLYFDSLPNLAIVTSDYGLVFDIVFS